MNSTFTFDAINNAVCWSLHGKVTDQIFSEDLRSVAALLSGTSPMSGIIDFSGVTSFEVSTQSIKKLADTEPILPAAVPRVIVAPADHLYGLARMFSILSEHKRPNLFVVRSIDEAYQALKIASPQFRPLALQHKTST